MNFQTPKGTRDFLPEDMAMRQKVIGALVSNYQLFGFKQWDGPAFEYLETLTCKSGEEITREIYNFQDKAGRQLGLRFELTASIARIVASRPDLRKPLKTYNIAKVWRYERPQSGRFREFLQADADIFGSSRMTSETELILMAVSALEKLGLKEYFILLNNRKILMSQLRAVEINDDQQVYALRALDKLAKIGEKGVRSEFLAHNIPSEKFDELSSFMKISGTSIQRLEELRKLLKEDPKGIEGINELQEIVTLLNGAGLKDSVEITTSLVRGLDYYTGPIFEIHSKTKKGIGSFAGGGRYDKLVKLFGGQSTPAVGISFGIERLIEILGEDTQIAGYDQTVKVFVAYATPELLPLVLQVVQQFRQSGISAEYDLQGRRLGQQLTYVNINKIPFSFLVLSQNEQKLKDMASGQEDSLSVEQAISKLSSL